MTDVRLTATNPEDSSVVPVACNAKGELKLEEVPTFDGNVDGDLTVSGSATFAGGNFQVFSGGELKATVETATQNEGAFNLNAGSGSDSNRFSIRKDGSVYIGTGWGSNAEIAETKLYSDGSASFANGKTIISAAGSVGVGANGADTGTTIRATDGAITAFAGVYIGGTTGIYKTNLNADGSCTFAGNKAGFTAEGYLWCTTRRGDTVILDFTSNGMATWAPYTPPNRLTELQDRWSEKDVIRPVPQESSQDEPDITQ